MPFRMIVSSAQSESQLHFPDDRERPVAERLVAEFRAGTTPMEGVFTTWHDGGVFRRRWADIRDMRIEEA